MSYTQTMSNKEFMESTNLKAVVNLLESHVGDVELISYGLAPNPNGFCYEIHSKLHSKQIEELDAALDSLTSKEEKELSALYLGN